MKIVGLDAVRKKLATLAAKSGKKVIRDGVKAGAKPMLQAAKAEAPKDTGTLVKALGVKQKTYRNGIVVVGMVGARVGQARSVTRSFTKRGKQRIKLKKTSDKSGPTQEVRDASRYLHLAESGRKAVRGKGKKLVMRLAGGQTVASNSAKAFAGHGFMAKAWRRVHREAKTAAVAAMTAAMATELKSA